MRVTLFKILLYLVVFTIPATTLGNMVTRRHFDGLNGNRLAAAKYTDAGAGPRYVPNYSTTYAYDQNSNITALTRKGLTGRLGTFGTVDDLTMTYDGNHLSKVTETADEVLLETSHDVQPMAITRPTVSQFRYDANGNTTMDQPRSISSITYNPLNLPQSVSIENSPNNLTSNPANRKYISYTYDASGVKHRVIHSSTKPDLSPTGHLTTADTTDYVGNRVYLNGKLDKVLTPYGYLQGGKFHTWLHDYQGNIVAVVVGDSVAQRNSYYPYGLPHATLSIRTNITTNTPNTYKYSGKEFDTFGGTDLYDFHARYHVPSTGRFMTVDPHSETYEGYSTYVYCFGNPINVIDPTGMDGARIIDSKNKTMTLRADYYVRTEPTIARDISSGQIITINGYSQNEISTMNIDFNGFLNGLNLYISEGEYEGFSLNFDLQFKDGGSMLNCESILMNQTQDISISNILTKGGNNVKGFNLTEDSDGKWSTLGGITGEGRIITMNDNIDYNMLNYIHEIGHTLGLTHPVGGAEQGIMAYPPETPTLEDANNLGRNKFLHTIKKDD